MDIDFLLLQEIRTCSEDLIKKLASVLGFEYHYYVMSERPQYAGVAIMTHHEFSPYTVDHILPGEGRILVVETANFTIVNLYSPYIGMGKVNLVKRADWEYNIMSLLKPMMDKPLIVCGDLNVAPQDIDRKNVIPSKQPGCSKDEAELFYTLLRNIELLDTFRVVHPLTPGFTWGISRGRLRLDYILTSKTIRCNNIEVIMDMHKPAKSPSDHYPLYAELYV